MEYLVQARNKRTKEFIEAILPSMIKQLRLQNSRKALFVKISKSDIESNNMGQTAYIQAVDGIVVIISPQSREKMGLTLAHEMIHVKQMAKGVLKTYNGVSYWRGKRVGKKVKYLDQPWEIEAFSKQELIFRRAIE